MPNLLQSQKGQSLIQVLVSIAIMSVLALVFSTMMSTQSREVLALNETLARSDLQQQLTRSFADGTVCTNMLTLPTALFFDNTNAMPGSPNPPSVTVARAVIPVSMAAGAPPLVTAGNTVSPLSTTLRVATPVAFQVTGITGSSSGGVGTYTGNFQINFDQTRVIHPLKPASSQIVLKTATTGALETISSCSMMGTAFKTQTFVLSEDGGAVATNYCPTGMKVTSCQSYIVPSGDRVCPTTITVDGMGCTHGSCASASALEGAAASWTVQMICGSLP